LTWFAFDWVDAFTDTAFGGNPCAVVHDADAVPEERRIAFVRETGLVECAYVVSSDRADFGARYYLADREIGMAGHPTVATVAALIGRGAIAVGEAPVEITLEVGAGILPVRIEPQEGAGALITMTQRAPEFGTMHAPAEIAEIYGLNADDVVAVPQTVSTGTPFCIAVLRDHAVLGRARLDPGLLAAFRRRDGHPDATLMEPFLVTLEGATPAGDTFSRLMLAPPNPPEDPFTGAATGCMAAYLWAHGLIERPVFTAEQGHWMGRPGSARVEVLGPPDRIEGVRVGGSAVIVMQGTVEL